MADTPFPLNRYITCFPVATWESMFTLPKSDKFQVRSDDSELRKC